MGLVLLMNDGSRADGLDIVAIGIDQEAP